MVQVTTTKNYFIHMHHVPTWAMWCHRIICDMTRSHVTSICTSPMPIISSVIYALVIIYYEFMQSICGPSSIGGHWCFTHKQIFIFFVEKSTTLKSPTTLQNWGRKYFNFNPYRPTWFFWVQFSYSMCLDIHVVLGSPSKC